MNNELRLRTPIAKVEKHQQIISEQFISPQYVKKAKLQGTTSVHHFITLVEKQPG
jgi:hypothetical protein